jgi:hypothetical protein
MSGGEVFTYRSSGRVVADPESTPEHYGRRRTFRSASKIASATDPMGLGRY